MQLVSSLFDRLALQAAAPESRRKALDQLRRDVEVILNSRRTSALIPDSLGESQRSLLTFGVPDFSSSSYSPQDHGRQLARDIQSTIERFEPRLSAVAVDQIEHERSEQSGVFHFRIKARLRAHPTDDPIVFDTVAETHDWRVSLAGA